jgi:hypothetical protein
MVAVDVEERHWICAGAICDCHCRRYRRDRGYAARHPAGEVISQHAALGHAGDVNPLWVDGILFAQHVDQACDKAHVIDSFDFGVSLGWVAAGIPVQAVASPASRWIGDNETVPFRHRVPATPATKSLWVAATTVQRNY